jgi:sortase A
VPSGHEVAPTGSVYLGKHLLTAFIALVFLAGAAVFFYPLVADALNAQYQTRAVASYHEAVRNTDGDRLSELLAAASAYNESLADSPGRFEPSKEELERYSALMLVTGSGVMGTLEIPSVGVNLPIYHGTGENVLQSGAGHLEGTSLPVGGAGTHAVITGHRGLPSSTLLTDIDRMEIGDIFTLRVLGRTLAYEVDRVLIVLPDSFEPLALEPDMDYVTLLTCTPYGINSHRLLVRGHRVEDAVRTVVLNEAGKTNVLAVMAPPLALVAVTALLAQFMRRGGRY